MDENIYVNGQWYDIWHILSMEWYMSMAFNGRHDVWNCFIKFWQKINKIFNIILLKRIYKEDRAKKYVKTQHLYIRYAPCITNLWTWFSLCWIRSSFFTFIAWYGDHTTEQNSSWDLPNLSKVKGYQSKNILKSPKSSFNRFLLALVVILSIWLFQRGCSL